MKNTDRKLVRNFLNTSIAFALAFLLVSAKYAEAQGPIMTIYDTNDQVNRMNETLDQLNIQDVRIYDERLDGIEELLRTAFLEIGERFREIQDKQAEIEGMLNNIQSKLVNPLQTTHWVSPYFRVSFHFSESKTWGTLVFQEEGWTVITILNVDTTPVDAVLYLYNEDGSLWQSFTDIKIPVGEVYEKWVHYRFTGEISGHLEITATGNVVPYGSISLKKHKVFYDNDVCCMDDDGEWGWGQSYAYPLKWYPKAPNQQNNPDPID